MSALFSLVSGKTLVFGAAGLVLLALLYWSERKLEDFGAANAALATAQQVNQANTAELDRLRADTDRATQAATASLEQDRLRRTEQTKLSLEIDHVPNSAGTAVPPVIVAAIRGLFGPDASAAGTNQGSAPAGAGAAAAMSSGTGTVRR